MKKKVKLFLTVIFTIIVIAGISMPSEAASAKNNKKWAKAYMKIVNQVNEKDKKDSFATYSYNLLYLDSDSMPELVVDQNGYRVFLYAYSKGRVYTLMDGWGYGVGGNVGYDYIPKTGKVINSSGIFAGCIRYYTRFKLENHKLLKRDKKLLFSSLFKNNNDPSEKDMLKNPQYYYGKKRISKSKFNEYISKGKYVHIEGKYSYKKMEANLNKA